MNAAMRLCVSITVSGWVCLTAPAQVPDGASNTYVNATNAFVDVTIGTNGSFTLLTLGSNAMFTNTGSGVIGLNATARSNEVRLVSPTARWFVGNQIHVGSNGSFNRLLVSNGATVRAFNGNLSLGTGSNNLALVTGPGSSWSNANLFYLGFNGSGNQLVLSNGGVLYNNSAILGVNSGGFSNVAIVTGAGSLWSNRSDLSIGFNGAGTRLEVRDGGYVRSRIGGIGSQVGATNILALVTDPGSTWSNAAELYVGVQGPANQMIVAAGGTVRSAVGYVGANFTASNNVALVTDAGSMWSNEVALVIGSFSSNNRLVVSNGALVRVAMNAVIGPTPNGNANSARVTDANSRWLVGGTVHVGSNSALNRLVVTNGGQVFGFGAISGAMGWGNAGSNNLTVVTGAGSVWSNANSFYVGGNAPANQMVVSNGGMVFSDQSFVGSNLPSSNNVVEVTGPGSRWNVDGALYLGWDGAGNRLEISDGGVTYDVASTLGVNFSSSNNLALVTGPGSLWTNLFQLLVGQSSPRNQLIVSNGGFVFAGEVATIGGFGSSTNNRVLVDGGTLRVANPALIGVLDVRRGTNVFNAGLIDVDRLVMTNALSRFDFNGGTLITRGAAISNDFGLLMGAAATHPAIWAVHSGAGDHTFGVPFVMGIPSPFNQLLITNGAVMRSSSYALTGVDTASVSNLVLISGTNSTWLLRDLYIGYSGNHNWLIVSNGGFLGANYTVIGGEGNTTNCEAVVTGSGSVMSNALMLQIGSSGSSNRVRIENGGKLRSSVQVGRTWESVGNLLSVTGPGSRVDTHTNLEPISVGYDGASSRMEVTDGGAVFGYAGEVGRSLSSSNNLAVVRGSGSVWSNVNDLYIGVSGAGNRLEVRNGGSLNNYNGFIGVNAYSSNNLVSVIDPGTVWTNRRELAVGLNGISNQMVVSNGATVFTFANKYVGYNDGALSNTVVVTDPGSAWLGDDSLYVGGAGAFNRLLVRNGGRVVNGLGTLGAVLAANGNEVLVTDAGSVWTNQHELTVGDDGSGNILMISNGATVLSASSGFIGRGSGGSSNAAFVTGLGSRWLLSSNLYVGSNGAFNRLVISNGAYVENDYASVGNALSSSNNEVVVTGNGSVWTNQDVLSLGVFGSGNRLVLSQGAKMRSNLGYVGVNFSSSNNQAILTGSGTFWRVPNSLIFGSQSSGNRLVISNGAALSTDGAYVGFSNICSNNVAIITGTGSAWTNTGPMYVGDFSPANLLMITNGGMLVSSRIITVGDHVFAPDNRVVIDGGTLMVTTESFEVRRGTNVLSAGLADLNELLITNALGFFEFNGGRLLSSGTTNSNGRVFTVGNGTNTAELQLRGGVHHFANGLAIANQGLLTGTGTLLGTVSVAFGATLSPGVSIGVIALTNAPVLQGVTAMEITRSGSVLTNDQVRVAGQLAYGGSLVVTNSGPGALGAGDRFALFSAAGFSGGFTNVLLPPLAPGLQWTNKLGWDGSIEVAAYQPPPVALTILRSNGLLIVSWPTNGADYCLETTFDLSPPVLWKTVSNGISTNGGSFVFSLASNGEFSKQFFRLAFPCSVSPVALVLQIDNNLVTVSWPSNAFRLETTFNLSPPVAWQPINTGITSTNGVRTFALTNDAAVAQQFFRLAFP
jgi:T5SS/PEP-CTERM-associated repeat protein